MSLTMTNIAKKDLVDMDKSIKSVDDSRSSRRIRIDKHKYYLHQFVSKINRPLYDVFICYGVDEFFECNDDDIWLNFSAMLEEREERDAGISSPRPRTGDQKIIKKLLDRR